MSFTTRCPACGTTFRIVPDQLKISDGWVRCGHCSDVFDATLFLEGEAVPAEPSVLSAPTPSPMATEPPLPAAVDDVEEGSWLVPPTPVSTPAMAHSPVEAEMPAGSEISEAVDDSFVEELRRFAQSSAYGEIELPPEPLPPACEAPHSPAVTGEVSPARLPEQGYELPVEPERSSEPPVSEEALLPAEPSFVRQAKRRAFWQSRGVRATLALATLLLGLVLLGQLTLHHRNRLAAQYPSMAPLLAGLCQPVGCEIGPVRQIESVVIDSSSLVRRLGSFYAFDFVLKNSAQTAVAVPALELSLTDTRDAVIVRRVFLPEELPGSPALVPAQGNLSLSLRLSIADQGVSSMSGYRALAFYP